jgi:predicted amino acid dehydrogenase
LSACLASADFWDEGFALRHSSTVANNNVACRAGIAVLDTLTKAGLCEAAAQRGKLLQICLAKLAKRYPRIIREVRGRGLLGAIELNPLSSESTFLSLLAHQGLYSYAVAATIAELASVLVLPTLGPGNILRVAPPLVISDRELKAAMDGIGDVLNLLNNNPVKTIATALGMLEPSARRSRRSAPEKPIRAIAPQLDRESEAPDYAFIVHRTSLEELPTTEPYLGGLSKEQRRRFCSSMGKLPPGVLLQAPAIHSPTGAIANGVILAMPVLPLDLARQGRRSVCEDIKHLVDLAHRLGAKIVGLGGYTVPYSRRGLDIVGRGPAITTGNALTAGVSFLASQRLLAQRGLAIDEANVAVVGVAGSVGMLCAKLLARENPRRLTLIGNPARGAEPLRRLAKSLAEISQAQIVVSTDIDRLSNCQLVMSATAAGRPILDGPAISPGTIVCDIARPPDTSPQLRARRDLTVIEGGRIRLPDSSVKFGVGNLQGLPAGVTVACLAETIILSLEGESRDIGIGDDVPLSLVDRMLKLAETHGFHLEEADQSPSPKRPRLPVRPPMEAHLSAVQ